MDGTYSMIEKALKNKGIDVRRADKKQVSLALRSEGINPDDYNFSLDKKDICIDAYENGNTIYMYKGYGSSKALCHEFIHKWWKKNGKNYYVSVIKGKFPNKWEEVCGSQEYSKILDNDMEVAGEVLAKSLEQELANYIADNKDSVDCISCKDLNEIRTFSKEDFCACLCASMFNGKEKFCNTISFSIFSSVDFGILMF